MGNDPGVLIPAAVNPGDTVSLEVTKAVQQALAAAASFVAFRIQTAAETDGDGLNYVRPISPRGRPPSVVYLK